MLIFTLTSLIMVQILLGGLDTILHHEFRERLAWQPSAKVELRLHAVRNFIYAGLFLVLAWTEPNGYFAFVILVFIALEVLITLWDFVEEDLSRKLPATERILHTLLTLNYGAILILVTPLLLVNGRAENALTFTHHGPASYGLSLAAIGLLFFTLRDFMAAKRLGKLQTIPPASLAASLKGRQNILITGATGFLGRRLGNALIESGHTVTVLTRTPEKAASSIKTPVHIITDLDQLRDDAAIDALIHLAGEPLATGLWTKSKRQTIIASRRDMLTATADLFERLYVPPKTIITASAIGWYGLRGEENLTEQSGAKDCFTHKVCHEVEQKADELTGFGCRVVKMRLGLILGLEEGILANLLVPFEYGLGGPVGNGQHWMSWIERDDAVRLIVHALQNESLEGPVNAVAPNPVRNQEFAALLGKALNRPTRLPMSANLIKFAFGDMGKELLLASQKVLPEKALQSGFVFQSPDLGQALARILPVKTKGNPCQKVITNRSQTYHLST